MGGGGRGLSRIISNYVDRMPFGLKTIYYLHATHIYGSSAKTNSWQESSDFCSSVGLYGGSVLSTLPPSFKGLLISFELF